jgi:hypothetical protein
VRHWWQLAAIVVAAALLILAPWRRPNSGQADWRNATWDIYDEIASGPADDDIPTVIRSGDGPY